MGRGRFDLLSAEDDEEPGGALRPLNAPDEWEFDPQYMCGVSLGCATSGSRLPSAWTAVTELLASSPSKTRPVAPAKATALAVTPFGP